MPNAFAYLALMLWPLVTAFLFQRLAPHRAAAWAIVAGYLLLPEATSFDFPGVPPLEKDAIAGLAVLGVLILRGVKPTEFIPESPAARILIIMFLFGPMATVLLNGDNLVYGPTVKHGLAPYDGLSLIARQGLNLIPLLIGRMLLRDPETHRDLVWILAIAGLAYSIPVLLEIRLSPQLHTWVYGFFPHSFLQQIRFGGFRPVVFLNHGLATSLFVALTVVACAICVSVLKGRDRETTRNRNLMTGGVAYMFVVLILCKTVSAAVLGLVGAMTAMLMRAKGQVLVAFVLASLVVAYPVLRGTGVFPTQTLVSAAEQISTARAYSLDFRFENEDILLEHAQGRPIFGWGSNGRNRLYDERFGKDVAVTDGAWIAIIGTFGWVGFLGQFLLLALPIMLLFGAMSRTGAPPAQTAGLCMLLALTMVNLLPNSSMPTFTWLTAGALLGYAETLTVRRRSRRSAVRTADEPGPARPAASGRRRPPRATYEPGIDSRRRTP